MSRSIGRSYLRNKQTFLVSLDSILIDCGVWLEATAPHRVWSHHHMHEPCYVDTLHHTLCAIPPSLLTACVWLSFGYQGTAQVVRHVFQLYKAMRLLICSAVATYDATFARGDYQIYVFGWTQRSTRTKDISGERQG